MNLATPNASIVAAPAQQWSATTLRQQLWLQQRTPLIFALLAAIISGGAGVGMIALMSAALQPDAGRLMLGLGFAAVCALAISARALAGILFATLSQGTLSHLRELLARRIAASSLRDLENLGPARVQSVATDDASHVALFLVSLPNIVMNAIIVIGCLAYLAVLSWPVCLAALAVIVLGSLGYHLGNSRALAYLEEAGKAQDRVFEHFGALFAGAKELKLHRTRSRDFLTRVLGPSIDAVREHKTDGFTIYALAASWGLLLIYAFVGVLCFTAGSWVSGGALAAAGYTIVFLYLLLPLDGLLNNLPAISQAVISLERIAQVLASTGSTEPECAPGAEPAAFREIRLAGLQHSYYHEKEDRSFSLGPLDLSLRPGELTFLIGGNGSGKTTLAKLITGLYVPEGGQLTLDGEAITSATRDRYRQLFATVFSDFYLFESLSGLGREDLDIKANALIAKLHLAHKVSIQNGMFSTRALSQGQRKRLALVVAYLEDRPCYVFDEWAADQDPLFKQVFYQELLPELKARGKCVLVISHDDRYFGDADRCIKLEDGRFVPWQGAAHGVAEGIAELTEVT